MEINYRVDKLDRQILSYLIQDARIPYTEIAKKLIVSPGTIHVRMKKMEEMGLVKGFTLLLEHSILGYDLSAFIGVHLEKGGTYRKVITELKKIPEVVESYYTTGQYGIFLKIVCRNTNHMREVLSDKIQVIEGIHSTETFISLEESIKRQIEMR